MSSRYVGDGYNRGRGGYRGNNRGNNRGGYRGNNRGNNRGRGGYSQSYSQGQDDGSRRYTRDYNEQCGRGYYSNNANHYRRDYNEQRGRDDTKPNTDFQLINKQRRDEEGRQITIRAVAINMYSSSRWMEHDYKSIIYLQDQLRLIRKSMMTYGRVLDGIDYKFFEAINNNARNVYTTVNGRSNDGIAVQFYYTQGKQICFPRSWGYIYEAMVPPMDYVPEYKEPEFNILFQLLLDLMETLLALGKVKIESNGQELTEEEIKRRNLNKRRVAIWDYTDIIEKHCRAIITQKIPKDQAFYDFYMILLCRFKLVKNGDSELIKKQLVDDYIAKTKLNNIFNITEELFNIWRFEYHIKFVLEDGYNKNKPDEQSYNDKNVAFLKVLDIIVKECVATYNNEIKFSKPQGMIMAVAWNRQFTMKLLPYVNHNFYTDFDGAIKKLLNRVTRDRIGDVMKELLELFNGDRDKIAHCIWEYISDAGFKICYLALIRYDDEIYNIIRKIIFDSYDHHPEVYSNNWFRCYYVSMVIDDNIFNNQSIGFKLLTVHTMTTLKYGINSSLFKEVQEFIMPEKDFPTRMKNAASKAHMGIDTKCSLIRWDIMKYNSTTDAQYDFRKTDIIRDYINGKIDISYLNIGA